MTMTLTAGIPQLRPSPCQSGSNCSQPQPWQLGLLVLALAFLSIGAGGIRPCNIAFGADQFDTTTEKGRRQLESFFNWWYFSFTIALLIALTGVVYVQTNISWVIGFAIPAACLAFSMTIFLIGCHTYIYMKPQGSVFSDMAKVVIAAFRKRRLDMGPGCDHQFYDPPSTGKLKRTNRFKFFDKAAVIAHPCELQGEGLPKNDWRLCSVHQVEQLKCLIAILPVLISGIVCFIPMDQQNTFGILQAMQMDTSIGSHFRMPPAWMNLTSMIALSLWIAIYERVYIPVTRKMSKKDKRLTMRQRIETGIVMSILCMLVGAVVEKCRRDSALKHNTFTSPLNVMALLPQFVLSGLTEAFGCVSIMEFFTTRLPENMRTVAGALFFLCLSLASYVSSLLVNIIHSITKRDGNYPWLGGHDLNKNRLDHYYYIIAGLATLNLIYFELYASKYAVNNDSGKGKKELQREEKSIACGSRNKVQGMDEEDGLERHGSN